MVRTEQQKTKAWHDVDKARSKYVREYETRFRNALNAQIAPVIVAIERGKANPDNYIVELPVLAVLQDLYETVGVDFARDSYRRIKGRKSLFLGYSVKADEPESQWTRDVRKWLKNDGAEKIVNITDTTRNFVKGVLDKGIKEGLSVDQMAALMQDEANGINLNRARVISRTEIVGSSNLGSIIGAMSTGINLEKEWAATPQPKRTRDHHLAADGQTRPLKEPFLVNGEAMQFPGDANGSASNVINCRCTILYNEVAATVPREEESPAPAFKPAKTTQEAEAQHLEILKETGLNIASVNFSKDLTIAQINEYGQQLSELVNDYEISKVYNTENPIKLTYQSNPKYFGYVAVNRGRANKIVEINFGSRGVTTARKPYKGMLESVQVDAGKELLYTQAHEFAHVIALAEHETAFNDGRMAGFWKDLKKVKASYSKELNSYAKNEDYESVSKISLGRYASTNASEFMAEAFSEYKLNSNPSKYANLVGALIDKYFKKK